MASPSFIEAWASASVFCLIASLSSPWMRRLEVGDRGLDRALSPAGDLVAVLLQRPLGRMDQRLGLVAGLDQLARASCPPRRGSRLP